jgi:phosphomannomutase/phosphoglucomutase
VFQSYRWREDLQPSNRKPSQKLFGTSGIRGSADGFLTTDFADRLGRTFAAFLEDRGSVYVGRDVRLHSRSIQNALMKGLLEGGVGVMDCGLVPTPALLFAMKEAKSLGGVMVTGSHTPPEIAGILFFLSDTGEMDPRGERAFEGIYASAPWRQHPPGSRGSLASLEILDAYSRTIEAKIGYIGEYKVVVDPGNGATCATLNRVLERLGCKVKTINGNPDGRFPGRPPNPQPSTLTQLSRAVKETNADIGIGTDSDGDRALFATERGRVLWADLTGAIFAKNELKRHVGGTVISTVNTSSIIKLLCQEYRGSLTVTRVGPPAIAEALRSTENVIFATEESGKHIWPSLILYGDAAVSTGKLLQIMKSEAMTLEQLQGDLPKFHQFKSTIPCPDQLKAEVMKLVILSWKGRSRDGRTQTSTIDGLRVEYPDSSWFLVRTSGTEPLLRCNAEARNLRRAQELLRIATRLALRGIRMAEEAQGT